MAWLTIQDVAHPTRKAALDTSESFRGSGNEPVREAARISTPMVAGVSTTVGTTG